MPASGSPLAISEITSLSANTVQVLEIGTARAARAATSPTSASGTCSRQDDLEEAAGAGGALVVHRAVEHPAAGAGSRPPMCRRTAAN
jgi:hypothetical protein